MDSFQLLSIGDANLDAFISPEESEALCKLDTKECLIAFSYGEKIPVKSLDFSVGGNAANNAVGAKRLGVNVGVVLTLGDDPIGAQIVERLKAEGVDLTYVVQQPGTESNFDVVIDYSGERTLFVYHAPRSYEFPVNLPLAPWVYLTSMGQSYRPFYNHFINWLKSNPSTKLAFNPGSWQMRSPIEEIKDVLSLTNIIFVNREEGEKLTKFGESQGKEKELLTSVSRLGPKTVVITDGPSGAFTLSQEKFLRVGILPVDVFQRTGAGDAFGSGFLAAVIKGKSIEEALLWGTVNSSSVVGYVGAQKGLLKEEEIPSWLQRCESSGVKVEEF